MSKVSKCNVGWSRIATDNLSACLRNRGKLISKRQDMQVAEHGKPLTEKALSIHIKACSQRALLSVAVLLAVLTQFIEPIFGQTQDEVPVATPQELRAALLSGATKVAITANLNFNEQNWPDPPVTITGQVTIYSYYRVKLDFCGTQGSPARPLVNVTAPGSLLLQKVFLRNFLPSAPQNLSGFGPVPALLSSGGPILFRLVVFHFLPAVTWVFNAPLADSFWAREGWTALTSVYTGQGMQLQHPALYLAKYSSLDSPIAKYSIAVCYSPMDLDSCYDDNAEDTTLVYCLYTFADSLRNPLVRNIRVFHDIGLDRLAYSSANPLVVTMPKSYRACTGARPSINLENLFAAVAVRNAVDFSGLRFKASLPTNYTAWPPDLPILLSLFEVSGSGVVTLNDSVVEVPDLADTVSQLQELPGCCSADPTRPNLRPDLASWPSPEQCEATAALAKLPVPVNSSGVIYDAWAPADEDWPAVTIRRWVLEHNAWQQYAAGVLNAYEALSAPSAAAWRFSNVQVRQADNANARALCFAGPMEQGAVMRGGLSVVANEVEMRRALGSGARYVQVVSDIKLTAENWPGGDSALTISAGIIEVRGCHPQFGNRYTIDLSDLTSVLVTRGRLIFQGDLRFVNVGWTTVSQSQLLAVASGTSEVSPLGAFALASSGLGSVECEGVVIDGVYNPSAFRYEDLLAVLHLNHMTPAIRARNASLRGDKGIRLGFWSMNQSLPQGKWVFTNTDINWAPITDTLTRQNGATLGSPSRHRDAGAPVQIIVPSIVSGLIFLVAVLFGILFIRRRRDHQVRSINHLASNALAAAAASLIAGGSCSGMKDQDAKGKGTVVLSSSMAEALAQAHSSGADGRDSEAAAALAAVLQVANKIFTSNGNSNCSASGTRTDLSGMAAAVALAASGKGKSERCGAPCCGPTSGEAVPGSGPAAADRPEEGQGQGLEQPPVRTDTLESRRNGPWGDINAAKREMVTGRYPPSTCMGAAHDDLVLQAVLGEGSYGRVYRALWRGTTVAVKVILLPAHMSGRERYERMAVMEAAISSSLSHPNIVQTYTYGVECVEGAKARRMRLAGSRCNSALPEASTNPLSGGTADGGGVGVGVGAATRQGEAQEGCGGDGDTLQRGEDVVAWEIRLVQEFCDLGSLRDKLNSRAFLRPPPLAAGSPLSLATAGEVTAPIASPPAAIIEESENEGVDEAVSARPISVAAPDGSMLVGRRGGGAGGSDNSTAVIDAAAANAANTGPDSRVCGPAPSPPLATAMIVDLEAVLDTAIDIARALVHLHREGIVHADLKPRNILLKGSTTDPRGFVAKVADFGLSMRLDPHETHVSNAYHGTLAYMAPETLLHGHVSHASDVYGFGILLYELYTGDVAFRGVPKALIGHAITKDNLRPIFPASLGAPFEYQLLACRCWESNPEIRPEFDFILEDLKRMRVRLCAAAHDESSVGPVSRPTPSLGVSAGESPGARLWGLPMLPHVPSHQFGLLNGQFHRAGGGGGGCCLTDGERTLSSSNSVTMSSIGALTGPHDAVTPAFNDVNGFEVGSLAQHLRGRPAMPVETVPSPACLDTPAMVDGDEEAAEVVRSL